MDGTIRVAKTKALISFAVTAKLICVFVFAYAKSQFSHDEAHMRVDLGTTCIQSGHVTNRATTSGWNIFDFIIHVYSPKEGTDNTGTKSWSKLKKCVKDNYNKKVSYLELP